MLIDFFRERAPISLVQASLEQGIWENLSAAKTKQSLLTSELNVNVLLTNCGPKLDHADKPPHPVAKQLTNQILQLLNI